MLSLVTAQVTNSISYSYAGVWGGESSISPVSILTTSSSSAVPVPHPGVKKPQYVLTSR